MPIEQINGHKIYHLRRFSTKFYGFNLQPFQRVIKETAKPKTNNDKCYGLQNLTNISMYRFFSSIV